MNLSTLKNRGERRADPRKAVELRCWVVEDAGEVQRFAHLTDLSGAGALVHTALPPIRGSVVMLKLRVTDLRPSGPLHAAWQEAEATVIWAVDGVRGRGGLMGVRFVCPQLFGN